LQHFLIWLPVEVESAESVHIKCFIDVLLDKRLGPQTINGHLIAIRSFYRYLQEEEQVARDNPVISGLSLRLPKPLPRFLQDSEVSAFFSVISKQRDLAIFMLMLRCGLRVEEVAHLTLGVVDHQRSQIMVRSGKGARDRLVFLNDDVAEALAAYLQTRPDTEEPRIFLVEKVFTEVSHYRSEVFRSGQNITLIKAVSMSPAINFVIRWQLIYSMLVPTLLQSNICLVTVGLRQRCVMPVWQTGRLAWIIIKP